MRENTSCDVDEPMSTPTLSRQISSSSMRVRPVFEKKMRPPASLVMRRTLSGHARRTDPDARLVPRGVHPALDAGARQGRRVLGTDERVLHPVRDRGAALVDVHAGVVDVRLAGRAGLASGRVGTEPGGQPERLLGDAEVLM